MHWNMQQGDWDKATVRAGGNHQSIWYWYINAPPHKHYS